MTMIIIDWFSFSFNVGTLVEVLTKFYEQFGTKPSCFLDLSHVMTTLEVNQSQITEVSIIIIVENTCFIIYSM